MHRDDLIKPWLERDWPFPGSECLGGLPEEVLFQGPSWLLRVLIGSDWTLEPLSCLSSDFGVGYRAENLPHLMKYIGLTWTHLLYSGFRVDGIKMSSNLTI